MITKKQLKNDIKRIEKAIEMIRLNQEYLTHGYDICKYALSVNKVSSNNTKYNCCLKDIDELLNK